MKLDRIVLSAGTLMKANFPEYIITIIISRVCSFDISVSFALCIICMTTSGMEFPALFRPPPTMAAGHLIFVSLQNGTILNYIRCIWIL